MTDKERQRLMDFIASWQIQFAANMQRLKEVFTSKAQTLEESDERANKRLDRLERRLKLSIRAGLRERKEIHEGINSLRASQAHTERRLMALTEIIRRRKNQE